MEPDRIRLLLVEDNPGDARLIRELLRQAEPFPFELAHVERLHEAVERLERRDTDAVLLDLGLPDSQGMDTMVQVLGAAPEIPIVVLTARSDDQTILEVVQAGAQDYLVKGEITGRLLAHSIRYAIERSRLERERWSLLHREQQARTVAENALRSRDEVLAVVAHDLRNPLAAISTTVSLLRNGTIPPEQSAHHLGVVQHSTEQMNRLIQDLLDVARMERGTFRIEPRPVLVDELLADAVNLLGASATQAGLLLRRESEPDLPEIQVDPQRIVQVLSNLVGNALRFSPRGGEIIVRARRFGDAVLFSVTDTGVGIPKDELPHLFDSQWQADHARRGGMGRGLAISKGIVVAHRGRIWAASEAGKGSTFFFTLPPAGEEVGGAVSPAPDRSGPADVVFGGEGCRALRVLLVDDHPAIRRGLAKILSSAAGIEVVGETITGEEALIMTERLRPDVVVMDLAMPGMGGIEATRQITTSMPEVRVLVVTAETEADALMAVLRAGGSGFVQKTTAHEDLLPALATVARDEVFLYVSGHRRLLEEFLRDQDPGPLAGLSEQDRQILRLAAEGFNSVEIGKKLYLSPRTIDSYRSRLMRQLGLSRRADLVRLALRSGLLKLDAPAQPPAQGDERTSHLPTGPPDRAHPAPRTGG
jgi:DNA-binding NarL/FixJ family response regulator